MRRPTQGEVTHESFRDKVLTFYERPSWHDLIGETSFVQKALKLAQANWAGSTDFYATMQLITEIVCEKKLGAGEIPDILVVSDMQFNEAIGSSSWKLAQNNIKSIFTDLGLELHGRSLDLPQIIFWNVRADTVGYPAAADDKGVMMLSGFSPVLLKFVLKNGGGGERQRGLCGQRREREEADLSERGLAQGALRLRAR